MNVLLSAVGRRAYLVEYFKQVAHPLGGKVYATNTHPDATGFFAADVAEIVPPSADPKYVDGDGVGGLTAAEMVKNTAKG